MFKKSLISIVLLIVFIIIIKSIKVDNRKTEEKDKIMVKNETEISFGYVEDDCLNEWDDYAISTQKEIEETSENTSDEDTTYIIKEKDNFIAIYYINKNKEGILYKVTDISTEYLGKEDIEKLQEGIEVTGIQSLQQLLEDFE